MAYIGEEVKDKNRLEIYRLIADRREISRSEISRVTGISSPTVNKVIAYLQELGVVYLEGKENISIGRKPVIVRYNSEAAYVVVVRYAKSKVCNLDFVDLSGTCRATKKIINPHTFVDFIRTDLQSYLLQAFEEFQIHPKSVLGCCIVMPGIIADDKGTVLYAPGLEITDSVDLRPDFDRISANTGVDISVENDVNLAAYGEYQYRKKAEHIQDMVYLECSRGCGAGIILNGKLRKGEFYQAGEFGYMTRTLSNGINRWDQVGDEERRLAVKGDLLNGSTAEALFSGALHLTLEQTTALIQDFAEEIAWTIVNGNVFLDVDCYVIGGEIAACFGDRIAMEVNRRLHQATPFKVHCELSKCKDAVIKGAMSMIEENKIGDVLKEEKA